MDYNVGSRVRVKLYSGKVVEAVSPPMTANNRVNRIILVFTVTPALSLAACGGSPQRSPLRFV